MDLDVPRPTHAVPLVPVLASVRGAPSHLGGIAPDVGSMLGPPFEAPPPSHARAHEHSNANMTSTDPRVEPPAPVHASTLTDDACNHRSVSDVGAIGPAPEAPQASRGHNIHTPNSTQPNLLPGLPQPSGGQRRHGSRTSGISELRRRELEQQEAEDECALAHLRLAVVIAEAKAQAARKATELAREAANNARSRSHAGGPGSTAATEQLHSNHGADGKTPAPPRTRQCARYPLSTTCTCNSA